MNKITTQYKKRLNKTWTKNSQLLTIGKNVTVFEDKFDAQTDTWCALVIKIPAGLWPEIQNVQAILEKASPEQIYRHPRYYHITACNLGWKKNIPLKQIEREIKKVCKQIAPFEIELKGVNFFPKIAFVQVFDKGNLSNAQLKIEKTIRSLRKPTFADENYIPHVSIVSFTNKHLTKLVKTARKLRNKKIGKFTVTALSLVEANPQLNAGRIQKTTNVKLSD